jgi:hypothetical protein
MQTCRYCKRNDLDDRAVKCYHCGEWLRTGNLLRRITLLVAWSIVIIFLLGVVGCAGFWAYIAVNAD